MRFLDFILKYPKPILDKARGDKSLSLDQLNYVESLFPKKVDSGQGLSENQPDADNFFTLQLHDYGYNAVEFILEIEKKYKLRKYNEHYVGVSVDQLERFIEEYRNFANLGSFSLPRVAGSRSIDWTDKLINKYADLWSWADLHVNPTIVWNFDIIEANKDRVNWAYISSYENLIWSAELLEKYRDYLVFATDNGYEKIGKNRRGNSFSIISSYYPTDSRNNHYGYLNGNISQSHTIQWSLDIIESVEGYWDWKQLSANNSIYWSLELIDRFDGYLDFKLLSKNKNVQWCDDLLDQYLECWDWEALSGNPGLNWSMNLIEKYQAKWQWKPERNWYWDDKSNSYPSISTNCGIEWSLEMVDRWFALIDLWRIARNGKIVDAVLFKYCSDFYRFELTGHKYYNYSDWNETEDIKTSGWENLVMNTNFHVNANNLQYLYENRISLTFADDSERRFARYADYVTIDYRLLELFYDCAITDVTIEDLVENENGWSKIFLNKNFLNDSIWKNVIKKELLKSQS